MAVMNGIDIVLLVRTIYSMWPKVCHNGGSVNARFVFCQLNLNIVNTYFHIVSIVFMSNDCAGHVKPKK